MSEAGLDLDALDFAKGAGLVTIVCQHALTGAVLMVAHADRQALERTLTSGQMHYRSRARGAWHKGATSGNVQRVVSLHADCDRDAVLARVLPEGPSCHSGSDTCFAGAPPEADVLARLGEVISSRLRDPVDGSYTNRLLEDRNLRLKKLGEESAELVVACMDGDRMRVAEEAADLIYHALVAVIGAGATVANVRDVLATREKRRGAETGNDPRVVIETTL